VGMFLILLLSNYAYAFVENLSIHNIYLQNLIGGEAPFYTSIFGKNRYSFFSSS
jgi:hypothetical protein